MHGDPVNGIDPTGYFNLGVSMTSIAIATTIGALATTFYVGGGLYNHYADADEAAELLPDGIVLSVGGGFAGAGLVGYVIPQVYVQFDPFDVFFYLTTEFGITPLSKFGSNYQGLQTTFGIYGVFDSDGPDDLTGSSTNAYYPWALLRMIYRAGIGGDRTEAPAGFLSPFVPQWWKGAMMTLQRYHRAATGRVTSSALSRITDSPGTFEVSRGMPGATLVGYARQEITFAWTLSRTDGPLSITDVGYLLGGIAGATAVESQLENFRDTVSTFSSTISDPDTWTQIFAQLRGLDLTARSPSS